MKQTLCHVYIIKIPLNFRTFFFVEHINSFQKVQTIAQLDVQYREIRVKNHFCHYVAFKAFRSKEVKERQFAKT